MNKVKKEPQWSAFLRFYTEQNKGRLTRLAVFENGNDYWLENGLALTGIAIEADSEDELSIQIMLGDKFTHCVTGAKGIKAIFSIEADHEGLEIEDFSGKTTFLRFEN